MKFLIQIPQLIYAGAEKVLVSFANDLVERGHEVEILESYERGNLKPQFDPRVTFHCICSKEYTAKYYASLVDIRAEENILQKLLKYPYMRHCTVYVQPSLSEAWGLTVQEAKIIGCSIVSTNFTGIEEQIVTGENGLIVDTMTPEALCDGIKALLDHPELRQKFTKNLLSHETYDNSSELSKLYNFIEG